MRWHLQRFSGSVCFQGEIELEKSELHLGPHNGRGSEQLQRTSAVNQLLGHTRIESIIGIPLPSQPVSSPKRTSKLCTGRSYTITTRSPSFSPKKFGGGLKLVAKIVKYNKPQCTCDTRYQQRPSPCDCKSWHRRCWQHPWRSSSR